MKKKLVYIVSLLLAGLFFCTTNVQAARTDMVDVSNHNGYMTVSNFQDMLNNYGVKSVITKISEGTYYHDYTAANNIYTAQQAGLYINGYHFARYTTVSGAIAEADYAATMAKVDGLPVGSVLVTDVEAQQQNGLSRSTNNANNRAFMDEIKKFGYRSDIYTMSSWLGTKMDIADGQGWIASYPYNASGKQWYSNNHAWQWGSTYQFQASYGNFDVSQIYDDFYTGQLSAVVDPKSTISNVVSVKGNSYKAYTTYHSDGSANTGTDVISGSDWKSSSIVAIDGKPYYVIGVETLVPQSITTFKGKVLINSDIPLHAVNLKGEVVGTNLDGGSAWKYAAVVNVPKVGYCYKIATDMYLPLKYAQGSGYKG